MLRQLSASNALLSPRFCCNENRYLPRQSRTVTCHSVANGNGNNSPAFEFGPQTVAVVHTTTFRPHGSREFIFWVRERDVLTVYRADVSISEFASLNARETAKYLLEKKRGKSMLCTFRVATSGS